MTTETTPSYTKGTGIRIDNPALLKQFVGMIRDVYHVEERLEKVLPDMKKAAYSQELQSLFEEYFALLESNEQHRGFCLRIIGKKKTEQSSLLAAEVSDGLYDAVYLTDAGTTTRDVELIRVTKRIIHQRIATYEVICSLSKRFGDKDIESVFHGKMKDERIIDSMLNRVLRHHVDLELI